MGGRRTKVVGSAKAEKPKKSAKEEVGKSEPKKTEKAVKPPRKRGPAEAGKAVSKKKIRKKRVRGKKYLDARKKMGARKPYSLPEAVRLVKETAYVGFDASVEVHINLGLDLNKSEHRIRTMVALPHGTGRKVRVLVFAVGEAADAALGAGADKIGGEEMIQKIAQSGKVEFDAVVATPQFMPKLAAIARILGPKGLMPSPKSGTIADSPAKIVSELKKGRIELRTEVQPIIHTVIGRVSSPEKALQENLEAVFEGVRRVKPAKVLGRYIKSVFIKSTMGPSIRVAVEA